MPPVNATRQIDRYTAVQYDGTNMHEISDHFGINTGYFWFQTTDDTLLYVSAYPDGTVKNQAVGRINVTDWVVSDRYNADGWRELAQGNYGSDTFQVLDNATYHARFNTVSDATPTATDTTATATTEPTTGTTDTTTTTPTDTTDPAAGTTTPTDSGTAATGTTAPDSGTPATDTTTTTDTGTPSTP